VAFTLPQFPLTCEIFSGPYLARVSRATSVCNLALGRRGVVLPDFEFGTTQIATGPTYVLFPPGTDVRDMNCNIPAQDLLELPQGSGRWYSVSLVDDVGKGFANEHRYAIVNKVSQRVNATDFAGLFWPIPIT
jgi:hypothetical protein